MCGRYFIDTLPEKIAEEFSVHVDTPLAASFNLAPTQLAPIVLDDEGGQRELVDARWGLIPFWAKDRKIASRTINARIETAASKPAFRAAWKKRRCLVPASGFFEWRKEGELKQPYAIVPTDRELFCFGGLWESWKDPDGDWLRSFTIVTTEARGTISELHHRMPVSLDAEGQNGWLSGEIQAPDDFLDSAPVTRCRFYPVSRAVNSPRNNRPDLLAPLEVAPNGGDAAV